jgi:hypothetical protein
MAAAVATVGKSGPAHASQTVVSSPQWPKCTAPLAKCAAHGNEYVPYLACCEEEKYECRYAPKLGWGMYCIPKGDDSYNPVATAPLPSASPVGKVYTAPSLTPALAPKCYENGIKCEGAPGYPYYQWAPCCDADSHCMENNELGWGKFCKAKTYKPVNPTYEPIAVPVLALAPPTAAAAQCYNDSVRCMGTSGYAYYHYMPCCNPKSVCAENKALGWGKFCSAPATDVMTVYNPVSTPVTLVEQKPGYKSDKMCYKTSVRCAGAPGYEAVPWHECCKPAERCVEDVHLGWGRFCIDVDAKVYDETAVVAPRDPVFEKPVVFLGGYEAKPTPFLKCRNANEDCSDASKCCDGSECVAQSWYGSLTGSKICVEKKAPLALVYPVTTVPPVKTCVKDIVNKCTETSDCCNKDFECRQEPQAGAGKFCLPNVTAPKCVALDAVCNFGKDVCCDEAICAIPVDEYIPSVMHHGMTTASPTVLTTNAAVSTTGAGTTSTAVTTAATTMTKTATTAAATTTKANPYRCVKLQCLKERLLG